MSAPVDPIAAVVGRMQAVANQLAASDGVARFNHLYLEVTQAVDAAAQATSFEDVAFMTALDIDFAGLYFNALDASNAGQAVSRCWAPLFASRADQRIAPIQFALAGMNAHINHDLSLALVSTWIGRGVSPRRDSAQYRDFVKVNGLLSQVEARAKAEFRAGLVQVADEVLGRVDDIVAMWSIEEARSAAWTHAEMLWTVRGHADLIAAFEDTLDGTVGLASRGLLVPTLL